MTKDRNRSRLGDERDHTVPCQFCGTHTWAVDGICDDCAKGDLLIGGGR